MPNIQTAKTTTTTTTTMITTFCPCNNMLKSMFVFFCGKCVCFSMLHFRIWPVIVNLILYGVVENVIMETIVTYCGSTWHHPHFSIYQETRFSRINISSTLSGPLQTSKPDLILFFIPGEIGKPWLE